MWIGWFLRNLIANGSFYSFPCYWRGDGSFYVAKKFYVFWATYIRIKKIFKKTQWHGFDEFKNHLARLLTTSEAYHYGSWFMYNNEQFQMEVRFQNTLNKVNVINNYGKVQVCTYLNCMFGNNRTNQTPIFSWDDTSSEVRFCFHCVSATLLRLFLKAVNS